MTRKDRANKLRGIGLHRRIRPDGFLLHNLRSEVGATLRLGLPTMLARTGMVLMISVDLLMTGAQGTTIQAGYGVAMPISVAVMLVGIGMLAAVAVLTAQSRGAGQYQRAGAIWQGGLVVACVSGLLIGGVLVEGHVLLGLIDPAPELHANALGALRAFGVGMPAILLYTSSILFLEGLGRPLPGMVVILVGNVLNALLNILLMEGSLGFSGAAGAALATSLARWIMAVAIIVYIWHLPDRATLGLGGRLRSFHEWTTARREVSTIFRIGFPMMCALMFESLAFTMISIFAARMGAQITAAYQILINLLAFLFMLAIGLSTAAAIRVGHAVGQSDLAGVRRAGWMAAAMIAGIMAVASLLLILLRESVAGIYSNDAEVLALLLPLIPVIALALFFDGLQAVLMGALRGAGDVIIPMIAQCFAFWGVMVTLAWFLGIESGYRLQGLVWAMAIGLIVSGIQLAARFWRVSNRKIKPARPLEKKV